VTALTTVKDNPLTTIGSVGALAAVGTLYPGLKDLLQELIRRWSGVEAAEIPTWLNILLLLLFVGLIVFEQYGPRKRVSQHPTRLLAVRHHSLMAVPAPILQDSDLPEDGGPWLIERVDCDLTRQLSHGNLAVSGAIAEQEHVWTRLEAHLQAQAPPRLAYYGVAHIPLQVWAGVRLSHASAMLFELVRAQGRWRELQHGKGPNLHLRQERRLAQGKPASLVIRVAVSYPVDLQDVRDVVPEPFDDVLITIGKPQPDVISHYEQAHSIAAMVREAIDSGMQRLPPKADVNLFFAGPMSVGFSIGKIISSSNHNSVIAYNHSRQETPRYHWGLRVNSPHAHDLVVEPTPVGSANSSFRMVR
jgi:hypothetical protein